MNPNLPLLQPYPFEKLRKLFSGLKITDEYTPIRLSIGEPRHPTPEVITRALTEHLPGLAIYPSTQGTETLREAIAAWLQKRYTLQAIDPATQILPVNGSREALFSFAQSLLDGKGGSARVVCPNPFYQIYEGAALLAGARPLFLNTESCRHFVFDPAQISAEEWQQVQLMFVCSPSNPTGHVLSFDEWKTLFELSDRYQFVLASDECYSEIYAPDAPAPLGALEAAQRLGHTDFKRLMVFSSLSKRSNAPGLRSGFVAGDAALIHDFLRYRTYHGCAMSLPLQAASTAAWQDETHVAANRRLYTEKFDQVIALLQPHTGVQRPDAGFYLWLRTPVDDTLFAQRLLAQYNVTVLPGSYLARDTGNGNPGRNHIRIALVAPLAECLEATHRMVNCLKSF